MIRSKHLLATLLAAAPLAAYAETSTTFDSVISIKERGMTTAITGVLVNDTAPTTLEFPANTTGADDRCERLLGLMVSQSGKYFFTVTTDFIYPTPPGGGTPTPVLIFVGCNLDVKP